MKTYLVGGAVRDRIMGRKAKDFDYTVVIEDGDLPHDDLTVDGADPFRFMVDHFKAEGYKVFVETPEHLTIRAQTPDRKETADFVLARKEGEYTDGRRPDRVEVGTLEDDIHRRDFTMNALAEDSDGNVIDIVGGQQDIRERVIRAVGSAYDRLEEDALRAVRALRFHVTTGFRIDRELEIAMNTVSVLDKVRDVIADERIMDEMNKMFKHDSVGTILAMYRHPALMRAMLAGKVNLEATMKQKGYQ